MNFKKKKTCRDCKFAIVEEVAPQERNGWLCAWGGIAYTRCARYKKKCRKKLVGLINKFFRRMFYEQDVD